jgi:hypothetical protein
MHFTKKLTAVLLTACMVVAAVPGAFATETTVTVETPETANLTEVDGSAETAVKIHSAAATTFKVTVPTSVTIAINADGTVTCPDNYQISNSSGADVQVSAITMTAADGWTLAKYADNDNLSAEKFNSQILSFQLSVGTDPKDDKATTVATKSKNSNNLSHTASSWASCWTIAGKSDLAITMAAKSSPFDSNGINSIGDNAQVAKITFTIGWANPATTNT